ncbi:hypothetical protein [Bacteroides acidifaciens]|uniref:hypothetical protein n=1 Tax=Bacteroides acidifaciens TaxID=85831 RepID=UPI0030150A00
MKSLLKVNDMAKAILIAFAMSCVFSANAQSIEDLWSRILIPFDYDYTFYGYDLRESSLDPSEYWVDYNWEEGEEIDLWGGTSGGNSNYIIRPYVTRLDENHVLLHGLLKDFCGLFDTSDDYTLVGEVNAEDMTITFQPQIYADGYVFAATPDDSINDYLISELKPVVVTIEAYDAINYLTVDDEHTFALFNQIEGKDGHYSSSIGHFEFSICGINKVITYDFIPESVSVIPRETPITEIQSIDLYCPSEVYENPNISDPIQIKKGDNVIAVSTSNYVQRDNAWHYIIELETPLNESGEYLVIIPKGIIGNKVYSEHEFTNGRSNPELTYNFTIVNDEKLEYDFDLIKSEPTNGETLDRLSQFKLIFASPVSINEAYVSDIQGIGKGTVTVDEADANSVIISIGSEIVNYGEYTFSFPQGVFGDAEYGENFTVGHTNPSFEVKYTISGKYQMFYDLEPIEIDPKSYETYDEVSETRITFDVPIVVNEEIAMKSFMYKDSKYVSNPISSIAVSPDDDKTVIVTFTNPLIEAGLYYITIETGAIGDTTYGIDYTYGHANKEFRFCYTISGKSGVDDIAVDRENGDEEYFNLQGIKVNKENLTPGIYIRKSGKKTEKVWIR